MYCARRLTQDAYWVGASDRRLALFENIYPIARGVSYNAYVVMDEKTVLLDTVDQAVVPQFFENLSHVLNGRSLDYLIVNHMEPDHCQAIAGVVARYPQVEIVGNTKTMAMLKQFFDFDVESRAHVVCEGDELSTGKHKFRFYMAPMVHWPEVMVTYDAHDRALYSADAFGTFGALSGNIYADEMDFARDWLDDARRYYANIVGKYGAQTQALLKKALKLDIQLLCPLHGPVWRENICWFIDKYDHWSSYTPEDNAVVIFYGTVYGHTENAATILANMLSERGVSGIKMYDVSKTHPSELVAEAFRASHLLFAASSYNGGVFTPMETLLLDLKAHALKNRVVGMIQNGSWAPTAMKTMTGILSGMPNMHILEPMITVKSALKPAGLQELEALANAFVKSLLSGKPGRRKFVCTVSGYVYDEQKGDPAREIAPGTLWENVPEDYACPLCKAGKEKFHME